MKSTPFNDTHTVLVTGAAGFIGSNLTDRLLQQKVNVIGYDNLSTGFPEFIEMARRHSHFTFINADLLDLGHLTKAMSGVDFVFHFSANADVRFGLEHPRKDLDQNTIATFNVLEAMRANGVKALAFSSSGSIYGETKVIPTPEQAPFPIQTSLYGASKLAGEGLIAAYCEGFGMKAWIFRFVSILGERYTHGHILDFYKMLLRDPSSLRVLGNGRQRKSYLYVQDCINGILHGVAHTDESVNIFNLGTDEFCQVSDSIDWITKQLGIVPRIDYTGGDRGWVGDNPCIFLDTSKIRGLGWRPVLTIREGVLTTLRWLDANQWVLHRRE